ncbi:ATP-binding protein [Anoxynatronum buryatiense]|uniref:Circadian input-output histidine kinase CikA n=1 Tax=Anoxynatronum buryatiense TaxID=489973 RepID=A0AA46AI03_9CLOT|nr:ATP-binding protein [Anoxynatronum buryatiense]SMP44454.1 PAS domain S-box-containing protein [Anoxynatronum buryatiense]
METVNLRTFLEQAPMGYAYHRMVCDADGQPVDYVFLDVNRAYEEMTGLKRENVLGKHLSQAVPEVLADHFDWVSFFAQAALEGKTIETEQYVPSLERYYRIKAIPAEEPHFICYVTDITAEKEQMERFRSVASALNDIVLDIDDTLRFTGVYTTDESQLFFPKETFIGKTVPEVFNEVTTRQIQENLERVQQNDSKLSTEYASWHTGEERWYQAVYLGRQDSFDRWRYNIVIRDITESRLAARALEESERSKSVLLSNLPGMAYRCRYDRHWTMEFVSEGCRILTGYSPDQLIGNRDCSFSDLILEEYRDQLWEAWVEATAEKKPMQAEYRILMADNTEKWVWEQGVPIYNDNGEVEALEGLVIDLSERKAMERAMRQARDAAESANLAKSQFLANMSHEIRTPMNGLYGFLQLMELTDLKGEQQEYLAHMRQSIDTLLSIVNDILDISRIESGKLELEYIPFDLREEMKAAVMPFSLRAREKELELSMIIDSEVPRQVMGDPIRLRQVLTNLVSNAVKFTEAGTVLIHATVSEKPLADEGEPMIVFRVMDTGIGISEAVQSRLFEPFVQAETSTTRRYGGTGLGLSIVRHIVALMGGWVNLASQPGKGTAITCTIPFPEMPEQAD